MLSDRMASVRGAVFAIAALLLGIGLGWVVVSGHSHLLEVAVGLLGVVALLAIPSAWTTQAFAFVSEAFPKAGRFVHAIPIDLGVVLSVVVLARWGLLALINPAALPRRPLGRFATFLTLWMVWMVFELLVGEVHRAHFTTMVVEGSALGATPLLACWIASQPTAMVGRLLVISRVALWFIICFVFVQALLHGHHTAISGVTVEAGGSTSGYDAIYARNNATNVGLKMVATYQNGNLLGGYLALAAPLVVLMRSARWRMVGFGACLLATVLTLSRGAWASVMMAFFALAVLSREDRWPAYLLLGIAPLAGLSSFIMRRLGHSLTTLSGRTHQYQLLWQSVSGHLTMGTFLAWFIGWGLGGGPSIAGGGQLVSLDSSLGWMYLATGMIGVALYGGMMWCVCRDAVSTRVGRVLVAGMIGTLLFETIDGQLFYVPTAWNFWLFAGLALASGRKPLPAVDADELDPCSAGWKTHCATGTHGQVN